MNADVLRAIQHPDQFRVQRVVSVPGDGPRFASERSLPAALAGSSRRAVEEYQTG